MLTYVDIATPLSETVSIVIRESQYPPVKSGRYYLQLIKKNEIDSVSINLSRFCFEKDFCELIDQNLKEKCDWFMNLSNRNLVRVRKGSVIFESTKEFDKVEISLSEAEWSMFQELDYVKFLTTDEFYIDEKVFFREKDVKRYRELFESESLVNSSKRGDVNPRLMMDVCFAQKILSACDGCIAGSLSQKNHECITTPTVGQVCDKSVNFVLKSQKVSAESVKLSYKKVMVQLNQPIVDLEPNVHAGLNLLERSNSGKMTLDLYLGYYLAVKDCST